MAFCESCGAKLDEGKTFCESCGKKIDNRPWDSSCKDNTTNASQGLFSKMDSNTDSPVQTTPEEVSQIKAIEEQKTREAELAFLKKQESLSNNYLLGFVGALLGGIVGAIPWGLIESQGWFVAWLGFLIAVAASKGYDLMKVKTCMKKMWFVIIATIIGVFAGQIMCDTIIIATDKELGGYFSELFKYFANNFGEYLSINASNLVLGLLFAGLGAFTVFLDIKKETALLKQLKQKYSGGAQ